MERGQQRQKIVQRTFCWDEDRKGSYVRQRARRDAWLQQRPMQEKKKERKRQNRQARLRLAIVQSYREREQWYSLQPDRRCQACGQLLPTTAFGGVCNADGFFPHARCHGCQEALRSQYWQVCCLCQKKKPRSQFLMRFKGYALCGGGAALTLCCQACEPPFLALSAIQQEQYVQSCCRHAFPDGQAIYAEIDPETDAIRYIGRTGNPALRHQQHLRDAQLLERKWHAEGPWYRRSSWIQELTNRQLAPTMQILQEVDVSPLVVELEKRYILHGLQQGWRLLNAETLNEGLITRVKTSAVDFDFLTVPFVTLVEQGFFAPDGLEAFLQTYVQ